MEKKLNIAILGASGYTGAELIRILHLHPQAHIALLSGDTQAGKEMGEVYPHLRFKKLPKLIPLEEADYTKIDVVFCCLPHGTTQQVVSKLPAHLKIIDLSADFRLRDPEEYAKWYGHPHQALVLQKEAVYGLTEHARAEVKSARLIANPGCYPTSALLPLIPLLKAEAIAPDNIIIDSKSGITGAGRAAQQNHLFAEIEGGISAYGIASHRHAPEIEQALGGARVTFTPHLMPMNRGILSTIYIELRGKATADDAKKILADTYQNEPFVHIMPDKFRPFTHQVRGTNDCVMNLFADRTPGRAIIVSVIDNLVKGAAGQAVQNMNVMCGFDETEGLKLTAVFP
jgi:N-acetyl-gamma-glutamyl-phosphate reductase